MPTRRRIVLKMASIMMSVGRLGAAVGATAKEVVVSVERRECSYEEYALHEC